MSRSRLFIENILVYGFGGMLAKLVPFLMLPIVTRIMPNTVYFGLSDLSNTLISLASAFAIMGMYDAMFRMFFEKEEDSFKKSICSTALAFVLGSSLIVSICLFILSDPISRLFFGGTQYSVLVCVAAVNVLSESGKTIVQAPTRMQNKRVVFIVMNLLSAILSYAISIPLLLLGEYVLALPIASLLASFFALVVFAILNRDWFHASSLDTKALKSMLCIGVPLMPTFLFYWVFSSADRLMLVSFLGVGAAGIFAVAAKLGQISQLIYTAFAQGWQYFAFSTMRDGDQVELTSRVYEYLGLVSFSAVSLLLVFLDPLYRFLFPPDYYEGIVATPYLFLAPLLLMLYQVAANQLLVIKKSWPSLFILLSGVVLNLLGNYYLIPIIGIEGAAISTLFGYLVTNIVALIVLAKMKLLKINARFYCVSLIFFIIFLLWRFVFFGNTLALSFCFVAFLVFEVLFYRKDLALVFRKKGA